MDAVGRGSTTLFELSDEGRPAHNRAVSSSPFPEFSGTAAALAVPPGRAGADDTGLAGRSEVLDRIERLADADTPLVVVSGPAGIGRTAVLSAAGDRLADRGIPVVAMRVAPDECSRPYAVADRLVDELAELVARTTARRPPTRSNVAGRTSGVRSNPARHRGVPVETAHRHRPTALAATLAAAATERLVIALDDGQWIDPESRAVLAAQLRRAAGARLTVLAGYRTPATGGDSAAVTGAVTVPLRPLPARAVTTLVADAIQAEPAGVLVDRVRRMGRGVPAAMHAAIEGYRRAGVLRVVDGYGCLADPVTPPELPADHPVFATLCRDGTAAWPVLTALAVLAPLGPAAPGLIAEATGLDPDEVTATLRAQRGAGVLTYGRPAGHWRFRMPVLAATLPGCLAPYQRRRLAQVAVTAVWSGAARCADHRYLPDQLAAAGRLVDADRSARCLLASGAAALAEEDPVAARWLRAAVAMATEPTVRARSLAAYADACRLIGDHARAARTAETVLDTLAGHLTRSQRHLAEICYVRSLKGADTRLRQPTVRYETTRALAATMLDRWGAVDDLPTARPRPGDPAGWLTSLLRIGRDTVLGTRLPEPDPMPPPSAPDHTRRTPWPQDARAVDAPARPRRYVSALARLHLVRGDLAEATAVRTTRRLSRDTDTPADQRQHTGATGGVPEGATGGMPEGAEAGMPGGAAVGAPEGAGAGVPEGSAIGAPGGVAGGVPGGAGGGVSGGAGAPVDRALFAALGGRWDTALEVGLAALDTGTLGDDPLAATALCRQLVTILAARGRLTLARSVLARARAASPTQPQLLRLAEAEIEATLTGGTSDGRYRRLLTTGLAIATEHGFALGTDELWLRLAEHAAARGNQREAARYAHRAGEAAELAGTDRARLNALLARVVAGADRDAAREAVTLARRRDQPYELAGTLTRVVEHGSADAAPLREAYRILGELDAPMVRAQLRSMMRARRVAVPGRAETVAENERLLARLVADGLTNRQLAAALRTSEKSVEGRLGRLFLRTGYRSRVELATAMLRGDYPG